jgi:hypothetical protein
MARNTLIQVRRGTSEQWSNANPQLAAGEWGYDTTLGRYKIGNNLLTWNDLPWASIRPTEEDISGSNGIGIDLNCCSTGVPVVNISVTGIQSSQVNNFNTAVSGLLPSFTGISGVNVGFNNTENKYTISLVDPVVDVGDVIGFVDAVNDRVNGLLTAGSNIQLTYLDNNNETSSLTIAVTGVSLVGHTHLSTDITDFTEAVQDVVGSGAGTDGFLVNGTGLAWNYDDFTNKLRVDITGIPSALISDIDSFISGTIDTSLIAGTGIGFSFDSEANVLAINVTGISNTLVQGLGTMSTQNSDSVEITDGSINVSGLTVNSTGVSLAGHTHVWSDVTDASATATLSELAYLSGVVAGTVSSSRAVVVDANKDVAGIRNLTTDGNVTVGGDLVVHGTSTTVNSTTVDIGDNIITVNTSGLPTGGFRVFRGGDAANDADYKSLIWNNNLSQWEFSGPKIVTTGNIVADCIQVSCTSLVSNLNAEYLNSQSGSYYLDWVNTTNKPTITGILTGDVAGTGSITLGNAGGTISIATTVQPNSVALGSDTTGQYASTVSVAGTGLSINSANADGTAYTITSNATAANVNSTVVARDGNGSFSATNITASQFIGGGSGLTNLNASNISTGTLASGLLPVVNPTSTSAGAVPNFISTLSVDAAGRVLSFTSGTHTLATTSVQGIASFNTNDFSVNAGAVSIKTSGVSNSQLVNDKITIGQTSLELGGTYSAISGVSNTSPVVLTYFAIDGGTP